jgi:flagellar basal body-associated protein FliL
MQWQPQKPPSDRTRLLAIAIVAIPITLIVVGALVLLWQLLGQASSGM